jgi:hypothetical protein
LFGRQISRLFVGCHFHPSDEAVRRNEDEQILSVSPACIVAIWRNPDASVWVDQGHDKFSLS